MANELRVRQNFIGGKVEDNPLTSTATTLTSAALAAVVAIDSTQHMPITLDPDGLYGEPEIAYITAHTAGATTATILRQQEGTTQRQHKQDVDWAHGPTAKDINDTGLGKVLSYRPAQTILTTTSATMVDMDATNLVQTFTTPLSGKVKVRISSISKVSAVGDAFFGVREGSTDVGVAIYAWTGTAYGSFSGFGVVTGLTPGSVHTYKAAFRVDSGFTLSCLFGGTYQGFGFEIEPVI